MLASMPVFGYRHKNFTILDIVGMAPSLETIRNGIQSNAYVIA